VVDCDGFANVDNLGFDQEGNIWGVTDMSTNLHNGFNTGAAGTPQTINHSVAGNAANLVGVFGSNWMFVIPVSGPNAGQTVPFAQGPVRCEMTGPTFVGDTLIVSVQHPGEDCPIGDGTVLSRNIEMLALDGTLYTQTRTGASRQQLALGWERSAEARGHRHHAAPGAPGQAAPLSP
jgi:secreted PhoX family phosphatase